MLNLISYVECAKYLIQNIVMFNGERGIILVETVPSDDEFIVKKTQNFMQCHATDNSALSQPFASAP